MDSPWFKNTYHNTQHLKRLHTNTFSAFKSGRRVASAMFEMLISEKLLSFNPYTASWLLLFTCYELCQLFHCSVRLSSEPVQDTSPAIRLGRPFVLCPAYSNKHDTKRFMNSLPTNMQRATNRCLRFKYSDSGSLRVQIWSNFMPHQHVSPALVMPSPPYVSWEESSVDMHHLDLLMGAALLFWSIIIPVVTTVTVIKHNNNFWSKCLVSKT